jgi:hypothetical protein
VAALAAAWTVLALSSAVLAQQAGPDDGPRQGILLLRNGSILQGQITKTAERYGVLVDGGQIHVKTGDVELCCRSLEEAYRHKRALIQLANAYDHLELAQWCQRQGLLGFAAQELAHAKALDSTHPLIPLVERRIKMSLWQPEPAPHPVEKGELPPPAEELDQLVRGMPPGSVEKFTQTIQPLLMNRCSTAGCHGPNTESEFRLLRIPAGRSPSRRLTQRNLRSTLQWVDREEPAASPILTAPIRPHGTAPAAIFTHQGIDQYKRLVDWVCQLAQKRGPTATARQDQPGQPPDQHKPPSLTLPAVHTAPVEPGTAHGTAPAGGNAGPPGQTSASPFTSGTGVVSLGDEEATGLGPDGGLPRVSTPSVRPAQRQAGLEADQEPGILSPAVQQATPLGQFVPVDPFDPEIFNRRFFPRRRTPGSRAAVPRQ